MTKNTLDNLTFRQKLAIEGEVSFILSTSFHDAEVLYRLYSCISEAPKKIKPYIFETFKKLTFFPESTYIKLKGELGVDEPPMWIWEDKVIEDVQQCLLLPDSFNIDKVSFNKKALKRNLIKSAFMMFCTKVGGTYQEALRPLCNKILEINNLEFLHESCFFILSCLSESLEAGQVKISKKEKLKRIKEVFITTFDVHEFLSFQIELKSLANMKNSVKEKDERTEDTEDEEKVMKMIDENGNVQDVSEDIKGLLSELFFEKNIKEGRKKKRVKDSFIVKKIFNSSKCSTTLKTFDSEEEAEKFITEIAENYPEILDTCTFVIENVNNPDIIKIIKK